MNNEYSPVEMIRALVEIPTVSRDSNLELIDFVSSYLEKHGVGSRRVTNTAGDKANLYASVGPDVSGGVVLSGHTDVVPIDDQDWSSDPFRLTEKSGRLYGRGTCDMKSFYAIALALVPKMQSLKKPIHFALSYDEEIGCLGAPDMIREIARELPAPQAVIVGEPTEMQVVTAHKSIFHFDTRITGREAHSSQPHRGVSAVMVAGRLINWLWEKQRDCAQRAPADCAFEPAHTSFHCGVVNGGTAHNIMAHHCQFVTDIRSIPGESAQKYFDEYQRYALEEVLPQMREICPDTNIEFEVNARVPAYCVEEDDPGVQLVKRLTGQNTVTSVAYGAEAGQFQEAGFSVVMCGPGSIDQAHQPDEYISLDQVDRGVEFINRLIDHLS
jgi:acetylornithine deacetylase